MLSEIPLSDFLAGRTQWGPMWFSMVTLASHLQNRLSLKMYHRVQSLVPCCSSYINELSNEAQQDSPVTTTGIQPASQPCYRNYSGTHYSKVETVVVCWCQMYRMYVMDWLLFLLQPIFCTICSPHQRVWNQVQTDPVQYKYVQSSLLHKCNSTMEHSASWRLPATTGELQDSTEYHPSDVNTCHSCFNLPDCTVFIRSWLVLSHRCFITLLSRHAPGAHATVRHFSTTNLYLIRMKMKLR